MQWRTNQPLMDVPAEMFCTGRALDLPPRLPLFLHTACCHSSNEPSGLCCGQGGLTTVRQVGEIGAALLEQPSSPTVRRSYCLVCVEYLVSALLTMSYSHFFLECSVHGYMGTPTPVYSTQSHIAA
jgi:hypothetical protein